MKQPANVTIHGSGPHELRLQLLTPQQVERDYLDLRFRTLYRELNWTKSIPTSAVDMRDQYDDQAWPFGIYFDGLFLSAIRVISADSTQELPSGFYIPQPTAYRGLVAEISKAMVVPSARGLGLFSAMLMHSQLEACAAAIDHIFISVIDSGRIRAFLDEQGFRVLGTPFQFLDHTISPEARAIVLHRDLGTHQLDLSAIAERRTQILSVARQKLAVWICPQQEKEPYE